MKANREPQIERAEWLRRYDRELAEVGRDMESPELTELAHHARVFVNYAEGLRAQLATTFEVGHKDGQVVFNVHRDVAPEHFVWTPAHARNRRPVDARRSSGRGRDFGDMIKLRIYAPGSGLGDLLVDAERSACGDLENGAGIGVRFEDQRCGFTLSWADLQSVVDEVRRLRGEKGTSGTSARRRWGALVGRVRCADADRAGARDHHQATGCRASSARALARARRLLPLRGVRGRERDFGDMKPGDLVRVRMTARGPVERLGKVGRLVEILDRRESPIASAFGRPGASTSLATRNGSSRSSRKGLQGHELRAIVGHDVPDGRAQGAGRHV